MEISSFVEDQLAFIAAEREEEVDESKTASVQFNGKDLERRGLGFTNLELDGSKIGFGGKTLVMLCRASATKSSDERSYFSGIIRAGDIVKIESQSSGSKKKTTSEDAAQGIEGVVSKVGDDLITVALSDDASTESIDKGLVSLVKLANDVTYDRMAKVMKKLLKESEKPSVLTQVLLGHCSPTPLQDESTLQDFRLFDTTLNQSQQRAVKHALLSPEIALIHGPPGTGKTYTLIEIIRQLDAQKKKILVCGPSNISVDNIVERLAHTGVPMVRIGHPARLLPAVVDHSLDVLTKTSAAGEIVKDIRSELDRNLTKMSKSVPKIKRELYKDNKILRQEYRERERKCVRDILGGSAVVLATLHGSGSFTLRNEKFDVVILDEASQALEASCWIPLLSAEKVILAGDHMQLSPMIKSTRTKHKYTTNPEQTLFERMLKVHGQGIKCLLTEQYRMHSLICQFSSEQLYEGKLVAGAGVGTRLLTDLKNVQKTDDTTVPLIFIDSQGGEFHEDPDSPQHVKSLQESRSNGREAELVLQHVNSLLAAGVVEDDIAIVTPYSAQVSLLARLIREERPNIEIGTVDGFQGREKQVVIVSLVRSNDERQVGFLSERKRLNVAMTRPKRQLVVIGDSETVKHGGKFMKDWMEWLTEHADLRYPEI